MPAFIDLPPLRSPLLGPPTPGRPGVATGGRWLRCLVVGGVLAALTACSSTRVAAPAPVEDRQPTAVSALPAPAPVTLPGAENAGKPGYYTVRPGDSLIRIGAETGQNWRDLARWNELENPNRLEVGQVLRVAPPVASKPAATPATPPSATAAAPAAPPGGGDAPTGAAPVAPAGVVAAKPLPAAQATPTGQATPAAGTEETLDLIWPTEGEVVGTFDNVKNKGVDIAGKLGQPVVAAADGRVLIAGTAVRGMGNLVILMHSNTLITAYAHNQTLLVKEDQVVKRGQKIAEMGSSDADRVKLHFEVRRKGFPVDPLKVLPPR